MIPFQPKRASGHISNLVVSSAIDNQFFKTVLGIIFMVLMSFQSYGQDETWKLLKEESGIKVYYQIVQCDETVDAVAPAVDPTQIHQHLKLKIENSNASGIGMEWNQDIKTTSNEGLIDITASPGTTIIDQNSKVPYLMLTKEDNDGYPKSFLEYLDLLKITIKP